MNSFWIGFPCFTIGYFLGATIMYFDWIRKIGKLRDEIRETRRNSEKYIEEIIKMMRECEKK